MTSELRRFPLFDNLVSKFYLFYDTGRCFKGIIIERPDAKTNLLFLSTTFSFHSFRYIKERKHARYRGRVLESDIQTLLSASPSFVFKNTLMFLKKLAQTLTAEQKQCKPKYSL